MDIHSYFGLKVLLIFVLVLMNAFFVAAEFSIVKIRRSKLEEMLQGGNKKARLAIKVTDSLDSYLNATQLGISLASLGLGWLAEPVFAVFLNPLFAPFFMENGIALHCLSYGLSFVLIVFIHAVLGVLIPKSIAIQKTETMVLFAVGPLYFFAKIFTPFLFVFDSIAKILLKIMGVNPVNGSALAHTEEEIKLIASASQRGGIIDKTESEIIKNAVDFSDKIAREVMIPRQDMECLYFENSYDDNIQIVKHTGHTRYPVCDEDKDNVIGMVHLRDLLMKQDQKDLSKMLREVLFVPESLSVSEVLHTMKKRCIHMAIVIDEYGGTSGLISMEDILEEIVGDIKDEHDLSTEVDAKLLADGSYEFLGMILLDEAMEYMGIHPLAEHEEDTIGGYVFGLLARKPEVGDKVECSLCSFEILETDGFRVKKVKAFINNRSDDQEGVDQENILDYDS